MNPQEVRPDHLQPPPEVSYPDSQMCAVLLRKQFQKSYMDDETTRNSYYGPNELNLHSLASYNGSDSRAEIFPCHIHGHHNHYWIL